MKIEDVLAKEFDKLTAEEMTFLKDYKEPSDDTARVNAAAKRERLKLEAKMKELSDALEAKEAELELATSGGSEAEKAQKQLEKLTEQFEAQKAELAAEKDAHATTTRSNALKAIAANVPWMPDINSKYVDTVMADAFDGVETADLADVAPQMIEKIVAGNTAFVSATGKTGAGTGSEKKAPETGKKTWTRESVAQAQKDGTFTENRQAIMTAYAAGEIE